MVNERTTLPLPIWKPPLSPNTCTATLPVGEATKPAGNRIVRSPLGVWSVVSWSVGTFADSTGVLVRVRVAVRLAVAVAVAVGVSVVLGVVVTVALGVAVSVALVVGLGVRVGVLVG
jgi:hypothetical protein